MRVASINIWGLLVSKDRRARIEALARHLLELADAEAFDIVAVQELWVARDFQWLKQTLAPRYPHAFYFRSGVMGSGLATFSRFPIRDAAFQRFQLNGKAQRPLDGDWWGGKGVGLTRIAIDPSTTVNFYNTHLHAEYDKAAQPYLGHRLCQTDELLRFVAATSAPAPGAPAPLTIVAGDLNAQPSCITYDLFLRRALTDAALEAHARTALDPAALPPPTFNRPHCAYARPGHAPQRIDYIFYQPAGLRLVQCHVRDDPREPRGTPAPPALSDHGLVWAEFALDPAHAPPHVPAPLACPEIEQIVAVLDADVVSVQRDRRLHAALAGTQLFLFLAVSIVVGSLLVFVSIPWWALLVALLVAPVLLAGACLSAAVAFIWTTEEQATLLAFLRQWELQLLWAQNAAAPAGPALPAAVAEKAGKAAPHQSPLFLDGLLDDKLPPAHAAPLHAPLHATSQ